MEVNVVCLVCIKNYTWASFILMICFVTIIHILPVKEYAPKKTPVLFFSHLKPPEKCQYDNTKYPSEAVPWPTLFYHCLQPTSKQQIILTGRGGQGVCGEIKRGITNTLWYNLGNVGTGQNWVFSTINKVLYKIKIYPRNYLEGMVIIWVQVFSVTAPNKTSTNIYGEWWAGIIGWPQLEGTLKPI